MGKCPKYSPWSLFTEHKWSHGMHKESIKIAGEGTRKALPRWGLHAVKMVMLLGDLSAVIADGHGEAIVWQPL